MPPGRPQKMQAHFPHQILPFRSEPEPAKYWLHFQTLPRIQVPRRPSLAVLPHFPPQNQGILNGGNWIFLFFDDFPGSYIPLGHIAWFLDDMSQPSICRDIYKISFILCPLIPVRRDFFEHFSSICPFLFALWDFFQLFFSICPFLPTLWDFSGIFSLYVQVPPPYRIFLAFSPI